jgi:hypothetical protein
MSTAVRRFGNHRSCHLQGDYVLVVTNQVCICWSFWQPIQIRLFATNSYIFTLKIAPTMFAETFEGCHLQTRRREKVKSQPKRKISVIIIFSSAT